MARWLTALLVLHAGCGHATPPAEPRAEVASIPFAVVPELYEIDPYPDGAEKDLGSAFILNAPLRRPEEGSLDHALAVFSNVPLTRFQREVAPVVEKELRLPFDTGVVWRRASSNVVHALVVSKRRLATFEDIV